MRHTTINIQGNLISEEILRKIENAEANSQSAEHFGFERGSNLRSEIELAWSKIKLEWRHIGDKMENLPPTDPYGTALSRRWMEVFLGSIGFELSRQKSSLTGTNQQTYPISHTAENLDHLPIHIAGFTTRDRTERNTLDIKSRDGNSRFSPHGLVQEYLNVTEHVYGITTNGYYLRLLRDSGRLVKLAYIEFDIKRMLDEDKYSEFTTLYRLLHGSRFPKSRDAARESILDIYYQESIETGNRIREGLSKAVKESLLALGKGFLQHEDNTALREKISSGNLSPKDYYRQLLRVIYRLLFLMVTEERNLVYDEDDKDQLAQKKKLIYQQYYSIARLRSLSQKGFVFETRYTDLWTGLVNSFRLFDIGSTGIALGIKPLGGDLFNLDLIADLIRSKMSNKLLLECIKNLNEFRDEQNNLVPINYRSLDVEELGSVYEGLLDLHPVIEQIDSGHPDDVNFTFHGGTDRKTTGSYYTRPELVNELIKSALIPVIEQRLKEASNKEEQIKALLSLKVCDPAAGSGHMMLAAARTIAWYLARIESEEDNPTPSVFRKCLREVIQHCIYAVDMNPDAVELCKLAFWLESHNSGKPLSFLDHKIKNGNSLVGVTDLSVLSRPLPDEAFNPVTGDDREVCRELKRRNIAFRRSPQTDLFSSFGESIRIDTTSSVQTLNEIEWTSQDTLEGVEAIRNRFKKLRANLYHEENACNIWASAFFKTYSSIDDNTNPTSERLVQFFTSPSQYGQLVGSSRALAIEHKFFHWPIEFPEVYAQGGFDAIIGNPPWDIVELSEKEYFLNIDKRIAEAESAKQRKRLIQELINTKPDLYFQFNKKKHDTDCQRKYLQESDRFPESSKGRINLYPLFLENNISLIRENCRCGLIVPSDIAMGAYNADLFSKIIEENRLISFFDFENTQNLFPDVDSRYRFCLITLKSKNSKSSKIELMYQGRNVEDLLNPIKRITLTIDDLKLFSPNTYAPPIFQNLHDFAISKKIYSKYGILNNHETSNNKWNVSIRRMLSLSDGTELFIKSYDLNNRELDELEWTRLYSGKSIHQFDHRYGTFNNKIWSSTKLDEHVNSEFCIETEYYAKSKEVLKRTSTQLPRSFLIGYRDVTNSTNERTCIASFIPRVGCDSHCRNIYFENSSNLNISCFIGNLNSIPFDYFVRQKVIGTGLGSGTFEQLPVLPPTIFTTDVINVIIPKLIELVYSAWDIKNYADAIWGEIDENLKNLLRTKFEENNNSTGGHKWNPPNWCEIKPDGCPLPPFKWNEDRRAVLKAELDAIYAHLYGLTTEELRYILDPQDVYGPDFPGETFRVLKEKEIRQYGEYRTKRLVMEAWERMGYGAS